MSDIIPISVEEAVLRIREGAHAAAQDLGVHPEVDELIVRALQAGEVNAGLDARGELVVLATKEAMRRVFG